MLVYFLYAIFFISCLVLIGTILLQPGKADAGALFTSSISSTAFGPRGTQSVLSRITIGTAIVFMLTALLISMPALNGNVSVLNSAAPQTAAPTPAPAPAANTNADATVVPANDAGGEVNRSTTFPINSTTNTNTNSR